MVQRKEGVICVDNEAELLLIITMEYKVNKM